MKSVLTLAQSRREDLIETLIEFALYGRGVMSTNKVRETIIAIVNDLESRAALRAALATLDDVHDEDAL